MIDDPNVQNTLPCDSSPKDIEYKDMNRALEELAKIIDLNKVKRRSKELLKSNTYHFPECHPYISSMMRILKHYNMFKLNQY
jgi:hypothetical protein